MKYQDWRKKHAESGDGQFTQRGEQARGLGSSEAPAYKPTEEREPAAAADAAGPDGVAAGGRGGPERNQSRP
jgi:hypothetical protein